MSEHLLQPSDLLGAAFLLRRPSPEAFSFQYGDATIAARAGAPHLAIRWAEAPDLGGGTLHDFAFSRLQEALDIVAATRRLALATFRAQLHYFLWGPCDGKRQLTIVDTFELRWSMSATATVVPLPGSSPPSEPSPIAHHPSLRFYRLSQLSDDIFDSFRTAYLALECLVSSVASPRPGESEENWLVRVLSGALRPHLPLGFDPDGDTRELYKLGRLPLFHAKTGRAYYLPQSADGDKLTDWLVTMHGLLAALLHGHLNSRVASGWGWASQEVYDANSRATLKADEVVLRRGNVAQSVATSLQAVDDDRRFGNLWGHLTVDVPPALGAVDKLELRFKNQLWASTTLAEPLGLDEIDKVRVELNVTSANVRAPNPVHPT